MLYLDAAATSPLRPEARAAMLHVLDGGPANASAVHTPGRAARSMLQGAREQVASGVGRALAKSCFQPGGPKPIAWVPRAALPPHDRAFMLSGSPLRIRPYEH